MLLLAAPILFTIFCTSFGQEPTGFAILEVKNVVTKESVDVCVNLERPTGQTTNQLPFHLMWWDLKADNTVICQQPTGTAGYRFAPDELVPITYVTQTAQLDALCRQFSQYVPTASPIHYQVELATNAGVRAMLFLVERGAKNVNGTHDYLHSQFCNYDTQIASANNNTVFYMYKDKFEQLVKPALSGNRPSEVELRVHKPAHHFDLAIIPLFLMVVLTVGAGSLWTGKAAKDNYLRDQAQPVPTNQPAASEGKSAEEGAANEAQQADGGEPMEQRSCLSILCWTFFWVALLVLIVTVLASKYGAMISALIWALFGIFCVAKCLFALAKWLIFPGHHGEQRKLLSWRNYQLTPLGLICYGIATVLCVTWFFLRLHTLAFILLDLIDICIGACGIRYLCFYPIRYNKRGNRLEHNPNLKSRLIWSIVWFIVGAFIIVYYALAPPLIECRTTAPFDDENEKYQLSVGSLFVPMLNDPLGQCWDTGVELGYRHAAVSMLFVVFSSYFMPYWFYVDFLNDLKHCPYGIASLIGYSVGLLPVLVLLMFMQLNTVNMLPFTLLLPFPVFGGTIYALLKGTFAKLWAGQLKF